MFLEIGSGTGQHAAYFAANLPHIVWQATGWPLSLPVSKRGGVRRGWRTFRSRWCSTFTVIPR